MSNRSIWKMLHLLHTAPPGPQDGLTREELLSAGIDCHNDTYNPLTASGAVLRDNDRYSLSPAATEIFKDCVVANRKWEGYDIRVDYPKAFVIMPFSKDWSDQVKEELIKPALAGADLEYVRGDTSPRASELTEDIWNDLLQSGVIIADISALNANVFYELGLAHALGKAVFILKQKDADVPADFGGTHYYEYDLNDLEAGMKLLRDGLQVYTAKHRFAAVKNIYGG